MLHWPNHLLVTIVVDEHLYKVELHLALFLSAIFPQRWTEMLETNVADAYSAQPREREMTHAGGARNVGCGCATLDFQTQTVSYSGIKTSTKSDRDLHKGG